MKKIIAFSGSNASKSINQQLVTAVAGYVENAEVEIISLRDYAAPLFCIDDEEATGFPPAMEALNAKLAEADGYILSSPEYNSSVTPVLKNTIDWLSRISRQVFNDKPLLLLAASPGGRAGLSVRQHLEAILPRQGCQFIGHYGVGSFHQKMEHGALNDADDVAAIKALLQQLEAAM